MASTSFSDVFSYGSVAGQDQVSKDGSSQISRL